MTVRVTDQGGLTFDKVFTLNLSNVNEAPTNATLTAGSVAENSANGTVVGTVAGIDPDAGATFSYGLTDNAGGRFAINGTSGQLTVANGSLLNFEAAASHGVMVRVTSGVTLAAATVDGSPSMVLEGTDIAFDAFEAVIGSSSDDQIEVDEGDRFLFGGEGDDILSGGDGDDVIEGGHGSDEVRGGLGADRFIVGVGGDDRFVSGASIADDVIIDADADDRLFLRLSTISGSDDDADQIVPIKGGFFLRPVRQGQPLGYTFTEMDHHAAVFDPRTYQSAL